VTISGHTILARARNQEIAAYNGKDFIFAVKSAYPRGELVASFEPIEQSKPKQLNEPSSKVEIVDSGLLALSGLNLPKEIHQLLMDKGIESVEALVEKTAKEVLAIKGIGEKTLAEITVALESKNLSLKEVENDD
jgi:DNA-directed RNA polymerase alpha subunit